MCFHFSTVFLPIVRVSDKQTNDKSDKECYDNILKLQIEKILLIREKTFTEWGSMDVTVNDLLLVRVKDGTKYWIRVINRLTGSRINDIPSMCSHLTRLIRHPRDADYVLESCSTCKEVLAHNIHTSKKFMVHKGSKIIRMCAGADGPLLVVDTDCALSNLEWNIHLQNAQLHYIQQVPSERLDKRFLRLCYVERRDILLCTVKDWKEGQKYEIIAVKLDKGTFLWKLLGVVDGHTIARQSP